MGIGGHFVCFGKGPALLLIHGIGDSSDTWQPVFDELGRHHTIVAAASDFFFDRTWKSILWSFSLAAIPIERSKVNRRSADTAAELIEEGWNLVIFPEGGRSPDGWTQPFRGGAAYLARRTGRQTLHEVRTKIQRQ